jgi:hypothetical protein
MSITLIAPVGAERAAAGKSPERQREPIRSRNMYAHQHLHAQEMQRERLRQAEAQRLRRAAWRARRSLAARLLGQ